MKGFLSNNMIAFIFGIVSVTFTAYIFLASRNDPGLRMAALVSATSTASSLLAIASTLLTGKDLTQSRDPANLPPNTKTIDTSTVTVGPVVPTQPVEPAQTKEG